MENQITFLPCSLPELKNFISQGVKEAIADLLDTKAAEPDGYLSRAETAKELKVSLQTLNELTKAGTLTCYRIGARVLYKRADIAAALVPSDRYRRTGKKTGPKPKAA